MRSEWDAVAVLDTLADVASALRFLHSNGIVHGDLKVEVFRRFAFVVWKFHDLNLKLSYLSVVISLFSGRECAPGCKRSRQERLHGQAV